MKDIVIDILKKENSPGGYADFGEKVLLDKNNFKIINSSYDDNVKIAFIDGGNNEIAASPHFALHMVRVFAVTYQGNKRIDSKKYEFYCLASAEKNGKDIVYAVKIYPISHSMEVPSYDSFDETLRTGARRIHPSKICESVRKLAEIDIAAKIADELSQGDIIVRDGDLMQDATHEKKFYDSLKTNSQKNGVIVCGISKTTDLFTENGHSLASTISNMGPEGNWYYPFESQDISFVKLHPKSKYVFRFDCNIGSIENVLPILVDNSRDPVFLGYPYGLIDADRFGRVANSEAEHARIKLKMAAGKDWKLIEKGLKASDAHSILDNIG